MSVAISAGAPVREAEPARLGSGVVRTDDAADVRRGRRNVDDPTPAPRSHSRENPPSDQEGGLEVHSQDAVPVLFGDLVDRLNAGDPGVVD
jgi:hypothetical protein